MVAQVLVLILFSICLFSQTFSLQRLCFAEMLYIFFACLGRGHSWVEVSPFPEVYGL